MAYSHKGNSGNSNFYIEYKIIQQNTYIQYTLKTHKVFEKRIFTVTCYLLGLKHCILYVYKVTVSQFLLLPTVTPVLLFRALLNRMIANHEFKYYNQLNFN